MGGIGWTNFLTVSFENHLTGTWGAGSIYFSGTEDWGVDSLGLWVSQGSFGEGGLPSIGCSFSEAVGEGWMVFKEGGWVNSSSIVGCSCFGWVDVPAMGSTLKVGLEYPKLKLDLLTPFEKNFSRIKSTLLTIFSILWDNNTKEASLSWAIAYCRFEESSKILFTILRAFWIFFIILKVSREP